VLEAAGEPVEAPHPRVREEGAGAVAGVGENLGRGRDALGQLGVLVVTAEGARVLAGEQAGVGRHRPGRGGDGTTEPDALAGETLEDGRGGEIGAVQTGRPRTHGIEHDQDDIGPLRCARSGGLGSGQQAGTRQSEGSGHARDARKAAGSDRAADGGERERHDRRLVFPGYGDEEQRSAHPEPRVDQTQQDAGQDVGEQGEDGERRVRREVRPRHGGQVAPGGLEDREGEPREGACESSALPAGPGHIREVGLCGGALERIHGSIILGPGGP
jgi:hypothetical protein